MRFSIPFVTALLIICYGAVLTGAQTTEFTYQGSLKNGAAAATGNFDFEFLLFDASTGGTQVGVTITASSIAVANGTFTVKLDFGSNYPGANRFLEIHLRQTGGGAFTALTPRQSVSSTPYAVKSLSADSATTATNANQLGGAAANQYVVTTDPRMTDPRPPTAGSASYIQNQNAAPQALSSFNISGNGIVNGDFATKGIVGIGTTSPGETLDVQSATESVALRAKSTFRSSTLILDRASAASANSAQISFSSAGNTDFAMGTSQGSAGVSDFSIYNYGTASNAFTIQKSSGNVGIGTSSPNTSLHLLSPSTTGFAIQMENTSTAKRLYIGNYGTVGGGVHWPGLDSANTSFLYAENPLVFNTYGGIYFSGSSAAEHMRISPSGNVGIGTTNPNFKFEVNSTQNNQFAAAIRNVGSPTGASYGLLVRGGTSGNDTAFETDDLSGNTLLRVKGNGFTGIGVNNPTNRLHVVESNESNGYTALIQGNYYGLRTTGGIVALSAATGGASLTVGSTAVQVGGSLFATYLNISTNASITGTASVHGDANFDGLVTFNNMPNGGLPIVCYSTTSNFFSQCASSRRFKKNINDFSRGLDLIRSLRPVTFDWKSDDRHDIGLIAEEVETVEPMLATYLKDGQIQGVRYDLIGVVLINAVKEQQAQIESQQRQINELKRLVCLMNKQSEICKEEPK